MLQKRDIRIINKANIETMHTDPSFTKYNCLKFHDLVNSHNSIQSKKWFVAYKFKEMLKKF